ncbi:hypothetical protein [uncultured Thiodictyon sp.]|jgi:hypothetical protein|uniref:hypothetical protein n=1 Tax=uncultured Thiodictyon sp. TaxID=1846217 RepID=UPI0025E2243D|nr:hypothetical protein [uncultured Thiodictyon sp.]
MTTFNRTKTAAAVSALLAGMALAPANAVELAGNGLGDVAETSYYTVRAGQQTNISLVNTSGDYVVAVKVRFRQAADSRDVLDFNVFLSPNDVWTATVGLNAGTGLPWVQTTDLSCTTPTVMPKGTANTPANRQLGFVVVGSNANGAQIKQVDFVTGSNPLSTEGYIEIVEMGVAVPKSDIYPDASLLASWAVSTSRNCANLASVYPPTLRPILVTGSQARQAPPGITATCNADTNTGPTSLYQWPFIPSRGAAASGTTAFQAEFCEPLNVLKVASNIVRTNTGIVFDAPVTTFANFFSPTAGSENQLAPNANDLMGWTPQQVRPNLVDGSPAGATRSPLTGGIVGDPTNPALSSQVFNGVPRTAGFTYSSASPIPTVDAVGSLITTYEVDNEWWANNGVLPATGWVVNFPTKHHYGVQPSATTDDPFFGVYPRSYVYYGPFAVGTNQGSCQPVGLTYWDREEKEVVGIVEPSPPSGRCLPLEVSTISFRTGTNYFSSQNPNTFAIQLGFSSGWAALGFTSAGSIVSSITIATPVSYTFSGLPTIGFSATTIANGAINASYNTPHAYQRSIAP